MGRHKELIAVANFASCSIKLKSINPLDRYKNGGIAKIEQFFASGEPAKIYPMYSFADAFDLFSKLCIEQAATIR